MDSYYEPRYAIFETVCKSLSALTECVYNSKLYACISLNINLLLWWIWDSLKRSNGESTHIYGLLITPRKRGAESAELISI